MKEYENHGLGAGYEETKRKIDELNSKSHNYVFVGKVGQFCPIKPGCGGAELLAERKKKLKDIGEVISYDSVGGAAGYRWLEAENVRGICEENIDTSYYETLANKAIETINTFGDYEWFISDDPYVAGMF